MQWLQASLPIRYGGLGVRWVISLAISAFMASAVSTLSLQDQILIGSMPLSDRHSFSVFLQQRTGAQRWKFKSVLQEGCRTQPAATMLGTRPAESATNCVNTH